MIKRYSDHAANERTYLAWVRTAVAIMAFGFLIEKFDLFLSHMGKAAANSVRFPGSLSAELAGLGLFLVGVLVIVSASVRFFHYKRCIESEETFSYSVKKTNIVLSTLMVLLALFLAAYVGHQVLG